MDTVSREIFCYGSRSAPVDVFWRFRKLLLMQGFIAHSASLACEESPPNAHKTQRNLLAQAKDRAFHINQNRFRNVGMNVTGKQAVGAIWVWYDMIRVWQNKMTIGCSCPTQLAKARHSYMPIGALDRRSPVHHTIPLIRLLFHSSFPHHVFSC